MISFGNLCTFNSFHQKSICIPALSWACVHNNNFLWHNRVSFCTSGGSGLGRSGTDLSKFAKGADFKGGKDFTRGSGADIKKYIEDLLK